MEDKLITLETAKSAEEKGFNEKCDNVYACRESTRLAFTITDGRNSEIGRNEYSAPTQSLLQAWLRETHNIDVLVVKYFGKTIGGYYNFTIYGGTIPENMMEFKSYEDALEIGLQESLNLI